VHEAVEEATYVGLRQLGALALGNLVVLDPVKNLGENLTVTTISQCADWAIEAHGHNPRASHGGYAPEIRKLMIRGVRYSSEQDSRWQEQVGVSGRYITEEVVSDALQLFGLVSEQTTADKQAVRGMQLVSIEGQGVLDIVQKLDELASKRYGKTIFMGEAVTDDDMCDYEQVPQLAAARQAELDVDSRELADYLLQLESNNMDHWLANSMVGDFVKQRLLARARHNPRVAAEAFDYETAAGFQAASALRGQGNQQAAEQLEADIERRAPAPSFCGAGSCGLKEANIGGTLNEELRKKLRIEPGDKVLEDKVRVCKKCDQKTLVYAFNDRKVNTVCKNAKCGATNYSTGRVSK
jgi:hypothetical protein